jgi:c-di-GMP-binding flagellar brake protein YcgR
MENSTKSFNDYRYLPRWRVRNRISSRFIDSPEIHTRDISGAGARLETPSNALKPHQRFDFNLHLNEQTSLSLHGLVVWIHPISEKQDEVGIQFYNLSEETQDILLKYAFEMNGGAKSLWFRGWK